MNEQAVRKTVKYKLKPTPEQEQALAFVVRRRAPVPRTLYRRPARAQSGVEEGREEGRCA
jgi:hypothetical protein